MSPSLGLLHCLIRNSYLLPHSSRIYEYLGSRAEECAQRLQRMHVRLRTNRLWEKLLDDGVRLKIQLQGSGKRDRERLSRPLKLSREGGITCIYLRDNGAGISLKFISFFVFFKNAGQDRLFSS